MKCFYFFLLVIFSVEDYEKITINVKTKDLKSAVMPITSVVFLVKPYLNNNIIIRKK